MLTQQPTTNTVAFFDFMHHALQAVIDINSCAIESTASSLFSILCSSPRLPVDRSYAPALLYHVLCW